MSTLLKRMVSILRDSYLANRLVPPTIMGRLGRLQCEIWLRAYLRDRRPHTEGYTIYKEQLLRRTLRDGNLIDRFRDKRSLPPEFGVGIDERCVEYPWLISRLPVASGRLLDAGSTLNFALLLDLPALQNKMVHILTLAPERECFWQRGVSYIFHDVRDIPIRD